MKRIFIVASVSVLLGGCGPVSITTGDSISTVALENFFKKHKVEKNRAAALKKRSLGDSYLATIHGYPNNLAVCEELIAPYNKSTSKSIVPGSYYCEELR